jgi:hypothetical protein
VHSRRSLRRRLLSLAVGRFVFRLVEANMASFHFHVLALQLPFMQVSESMGSHDSKIVDAASVD